MGKTVDLLYQQGKPANVVDADRPWDDVHALRVVSIIVLAIGGLLYFCSSPA